MFRNEGMADAKMLVTISPACPAGMEKFFEKSFYPATDRMAAPSRPTEELMKRIWLQLRETAWSSLLQPDVSSEWTNGLTKRRSKTAALRHAFDVDRC